MLEQSRNIFKLSEKFLDKYRGGQPEWGPLGYITYKRTYARVLNEDEGTKTEEFWQTCKRVVEGVYNIQKAHCAKLRLPWNAHKSQKSAQEMFRRMWAFKFLPPGRGLWMMGTPYIWKQGSAALNNCFDGDTEIFIKNAAGGIRLSKLRDLEGQRINIVVNNSGDSKKAIVNNFGSQMLYDITLKPRGLRSNYELKYKATKDHRWILSNGESTRTLKEGDVLQASSCLIGHDYEENQGCDDWKRGFCHGLIFGNGRRHTYYPNRHLIRLCGEREQNHKEILAEMPEHKNTIYPKSFDGDAVVTLELDNENWKALPKNKNPSYIQGFLDGWIAACAQTKRNKSKTIYLDTTNSEAAEWVCKWGPICGYAITEWAVDKDLTNFGPTNKPLNRISLQEGSVDYTVVSVKEAYNDDVFCATVPGLNEFLLPGGIVTGNCAFVSTKELTTDFSAPFVFLMDMSMLGVGVGGDCKGAETITIRSPKMTDAEWVIPDTREGWVESVKILLDAFVGKGSIPVFNYSKIRPYGARIRGFGGTASGPGPLRDLHVNIAQVLSGGISKSESVYNADKSLKTLVFEEIKLESHDISSTEIVDIFNYIGKCVVAGNVRRCLPKGSLVHTQEGLVKIEDILPGMMARTSKGYMPISELIEQGVQEVLTIKTKLGEFECTPKHRIAILNSDKEYEWKRAYELRPGDRLIFPDGKIEGSETQLPMWNYKKSSHSTTHEGISIPELDSEMAWLIGLFHGGSYAHENKNDGNFNSSISVICDSKNQDIIERAEKNIQRFGVKTLRMDSKFNDNSVKVQAESRQLASYFDENLRKSIDIIRIPDFILKGTEEIRLSYLAGLFDANGSSLIRPLNLVTTAYKDFAKDVQALTASIGVLSRIKEVNKANGNGEYQVNIVGSYEIEKSVNSIFRYSKKFKDRRISNRSQNDYGYKSEWVSNFEIETSGEWSPSSKQITFGKYKELNGSSNLIPVEVLDLDYYGKEVETYDISVPGANEFVVGEGLLVHNTAEIMFGDPSDLDFIALKSDQEALTDRRWASNNSIYAEVGMDYELFAKMTATNGEPGYMWLDNARKYSRMCDNPDWKDRRAEGANPCVEQTLESFELCCLVETFPYKHDSLEDYLETLKYAYLYAKTVTLLPTHDQRTNAVMMRNRRIGCSQSGIQNNIAKVGFREHMRWCDSGFNRIKDLDKKYSDWLCIPRSIKKTSVKPSGTVSLLPGASPGVHFEHSEYYLRRIRVQKDSYIIDSCRSAGYDVDPCPYQPDSMVISFPVRVENFVKSKTDVTMWEQLELIAQMQAYWADNQVSATVTFSKEEAKSIATALSMYETRLKSISFLPLSEHGYKLAPYETITKEEYAAYVGRLDPLDLSQTGHEAEDKFCDGEACSIQF